MKAIGFVCEDCGTLITARPDSPGLLQCPNCGGGVRRHEEQVAVEATLVGVGVPAEMEPPVEDAREHPRDVFHRMVPWLGSSCVHAAGMLMLMFAIASAVPLPTRETRSPIPPMLGGEVVIQRAPEALDARPLETPADRILPKPGTKGPGADPTKTAGVVNGDLKDNPNPGGWTVRGTPMPPPLIRLPVQKPLMSGQLNYIGSGVRGLTGDTSEGKISDINGIFRNQDNPKDGISGIGDGSGDGVGDGVGKGGKGVGGGSGDGPGVDNVVFVIDQSGSVLSAFDQICGELRDFISYLNAPQSFHVVFFAKDTFQENPARRLMPATDGNKIEAARFLRGVRASGYGSCPIPALEAGFRALAGAKASEGKLLYLLTDGDFESSGHEYPSGGRVLRGNEAVVAWLRDHNANQAVQVNVIIVGDKPSGDTEACMRAIAKDNRGLYHYVAPK